MSSMSAIVICLLHRQETGVNFVITKSEDDMGISTDRERVVQIFDIQLLVYVFFENVGIYLM